MKLVFLLVTVAAIMLGQGTHDFRTDTETDSVSVRSYFPGRCSYGALLIRSDQAAGSNLYECDANNTWNMIGSSSTYSGQSSAVAFGGETTATLGSTPNTKSVTLFSNGSAMTPTTQYTISGPTITFATTLASGATILANWLTTNSTPGGITLSGSSSPQIRGSGIQSVSSASPTVSWPAGTVSGDLAVIYMGAAYAPTTPTGWTLQKSQTGANISAYIFSKVLNSTDIANGSVTITMAGTYNLVTSIVTFIGGTAGIRETDAAQTSAAVTSQSVSTTSGVLVTDTLLYFGGNRVASSTDTVGQGASLQQVIGSGPASGCIYYQTAISGTQNVSFLFSSAGAGGDTGAASAVVVVKGL